ncbi:proline-rich protein 4-like [Abrus precatorius]|uniref:Proline-rich protein 4-like n=1 Tax=Abrus precatorius TaxID=3816 RepID=A0A8B8LKE0_ABRPR|nr:proline-rich protein 4-like [Abrus precatorius]
MTEKCMLVLALAMVLAANSLADHSKPPPKEQHNSQVDNYPKRPPHTKPPQVDNYVPKPKPRQPPQLDNYFLKPRIPVKPPQLDNYVPRPKNPRKPPQLDNYKPIHKIPSKPPHKPATEELYLQEEQHNTKEKPNNYVRPRKPTIPPATNTYDDPLKSQFSKQDNTVVDNYPPKIPRSRPPGTN